MNQLVTVNPMEVSDIERVAMAIAKGGLFGSKDPNAVLTLCFLAYAEGQHPAVVFRDYHIIQGKPAKKADAMLRDFINAGGKVKWHTLDDQCADATFTHPAGEARIDWTIARAKTAGIDTAMWKKYPRQMLRSRCISEGVRTVYPGATSGLYEENEVRDIVAEGGFIEGQSKESAVSPDEPAADYQFPDGPAKNITKMKDMVRALWREIKGCGDETELDCLLLTDENKALIQQVINLENPGHRQELWEGDGKDNPGLSGLIEQVRREAQQKQQADEVCGNMGAG